MLLVLFPSCPCSPRGSVELVAVVAVVAVVACVKESAMPQHCGQLAIPVTLQYMYVRAGIQHHRCTFTCSDWFRGQLEGFRLA